MREPYTPFNFLALPEDQCRLETSRVVVVPVPYDSTTSFRAGAREGPLAIIEASRQLEDYDPELDADVAEVGIHTAPFLDPHMDGPQHMAQRVRRALDPYLRGGKLVGLLGGEHSLAIGAVTALADIHPVSGGSDGLSVLYLDAHGDLRDEYMGTRWGHASVARRLSEICPVVQLGVRCLSQEEMAFIREGGVHTTFWPPVPGTSPDPSQYFSDIIGRLSHRVYVSVDLDVLDPSLMPAVGTPEPGGMDWHQVTSLLRAVAESRRIVGFDVTELRPGEGSTASSYIAAKLVYKLIAYACLARG